MTNWKDLKKELLNDTEVKKEYERLNPYYKMVSQRIANRNKKQVDTKL